MEEAASGGSRLPVIGGAGWVGVPETNPDLKGAAGWGRLYVWP